VVVSLLRCWRAVMSRRSGGVSCTADGGCERATTGMIWRRESRDATKRARVVRGAAQQEQGESASWVYSRGWSMEALTQLVKLELAGCCCGWACAVLELLLPITITHSPVRPRSLSGTERRQLTFDRLLGARIIFELLAIVDWYCCCQTHCQCSRWVYARGLCEGRVLLLLPCQVYAIKMCRVVPYAAAGELVHALADARGTFLGSR
jgi:hypothetical protein